MEIVFEPFALAIGAAAIVFIVTIFFWRRRQTKERLIAGGIYSFVSARANFGVLKVLVVEDDIVHIRLYKNVFDTRPTTLDPNILTLGSMKDPDGNYGIGHLPMRRAGVEAWQPQLILIGTVSQEELEGYEIWKEAGGGVW